MGASRFSVQDVHRIGILDIRLVNTDRHAGNILVRRIIRFNCTFCFCFILCLSQAKFPRPSFSLLNHFFVLLLYCQVSL